MAFDGPDSVSFKWVKVFRYIYCKVLVIRESDKKV